MVPLFHYAERHCSTALTPWLWNYWEFRVESDGMPVQHHVPPDGSTSIAMVVVAGSVVHLAASGPWLEPFVVPVMPNCHYWGVRCRPESAGQVLGLPPEKLQGRNQLLVEIAAPLAASLRKDMAGATTLEEAAGAMDRVFAAHLNGATTPDSTARAAVDRLVASRGEATIAALATDLGLAPRTLLRRFRGATGLTPKQFARICRFRHAAMQLMLANRPGWAEMASGTGFADQAHMIHEFRELTGLTPEGLDQMVRKTSHGDLIV
jgi:AraC-like DNA-binding protein